MADQTRDAIDALVEELINDPLMRLVMKADRIDRVEAHAILASACVSLAARGGEGIADDTELVFAPSRSDRFRAGVGILLLNAAGDVFVGQRNDMDQDAWQMPQGGVDEDEDPLAAALRELREEIGTDKVAVVAQTEGWLRYEWPPEVARQVWDGRWRGQQQKWFAMRFLGDDGDIDIDTEHPEFSAWRWVSLQELPSLIVAFKRPVYERVVSLLAAAPDAV